MNTQIDKEVKLMLEVLKSYFHGYPLNPVLLENINWDKLEKAQGLHALQPMLYLVFTKNGLEIPTEFESTLSFFCAGQATLNILYKFEYEHIKCVFQSKGLPLTGFKGFIFSDFLFNAPVRAGSDLDLMISREKLRESLQTLIGMGYQLTTMWRKSLSLEDILNTNTSNFMVEVSLIKKPLHLDVHWAPCYSFLPYQIPNGLFWQAETESERIFWPLLIHHGGKENWLRLKNLADLAAFICKTGDEFNWDKALLKAREFGLQRTLINGLFLVKHYLEIEMPTNIDNELSHSCLNRTLTFWNTGKHWANTNTRWHYENVFVRAQDPDFKTFAYISKIIQTYSTPNPIEEKRFFTFPEKYTKLNFLSKVFTYAIRRTFS